MKKGKLGPQGRLVQRRRRAARRARGRERRRQNARRRAIEWLRDEVPWSARGWEMLIYSIDIPVAPEIAARFSPRASR
jgi:hypothetical protein